jgi:hypothetical protein
MKVLESNLPTTVETSFFEWTDAQIRHVLSYCKDTEIRVCTAVSENEKSIKAIVERRSAAYTRGEVEYLSLTELAISLAQVGQLLADRFYRVSPLYKEYYGHLVAARNSHQVYFTRLNVNFYHKVTGSTYLLEVELLKSFKIGNIFGMNLHFSVDTAVRGQTLCSMPTKG